MERDNMLAARLAITIMVDKRARALPGANQNAIEQLCALVDAAIERLGHSTTRLNKLCVEAAKLSSSLPETTENYFVASLLECIPEAERLYEEMKAPVERERRSPRDAVAVEQADATGQARRNEETSRQSTSEPDVSCPRTTVPVPAGRRPRARAPGGLRFALQRMADNGDKYAAQALAFPRRRGGRCCQIEISKSHRAGFIENMEKYGIKENQLDTDGTESQGYIYTRNKGTPNLFVLPGSFFTVKQLVWRQLPNFVCSSCNTGGRGCHYCVPKYVRFHDTYLSERNAEDVEGATALNALRAFNVERSTSSVFSGFLGN